MQKTVVFTPKGRKVEVSTVRNMYTNGRIETCLFWRGGSLVVPTGHDHWVRCATGGIDEVIDEYESEDDDD